MSGLCLNILRNASSLLQTFCSRFTFSTTLLQNVKFLMHLSSSPTTELLRLILCRECRKNDMFAVSVIKNWAHEYEDKFAELVCTQLTKNTNTPNRKRQRYIDVLTFKVVIYHSFNSIYPRKIVQPRVNII